MSGLFIVCGCETKVCDRNYIITTIVGYLFHFKDSHLHFYLNVIKWFLGSSQHFCPILDVLNALVFF